MRSMLPQSRNTTVRSPTSAGGSPTRSSKVHSRYSHGRGNSSGDMNMTVSLPSCLRIQCMASSEPSASPSGFSWVVRSSLSAWRSSSTTWPCSVATGGIRVFFQKLADSHPPINRLVIEELQGRCPLEAKFGGDRPLQKTVGGTQARERRSPLILPTQHTYVNAGVAKVWRGFDRSYRDKSDSGVLEPLGQARGQHLPHRLVHSPHPLAGHR